MARKEPEAYAKEYKEKRTAYKKQWYEANKEKLKAKAKAWRKDNLELAKNNHTEWVKHSIERLSDYYVNSSIRKGTSLKSKDIPKELTEVKRVAMLIERQLREVFKGRCRNPEKRREQKRISNARWREANRELIRERKKAARHKATTTRRSYV